MATTAVSSCDASGGATGAVPSATSSGAAGSPSACAVSPRAVRAASSVGGAGPRSAEPLARPSDAPPTGLAPCGSSCSS
eukprot:3151577-Alexandrium_andersonii.AAC.1